MDQIGFDSIYPFYTNTTAETVYTWLLIMAMVGSGTPWTEVVQKSSKEQVRPYTTIA
jgi:hypothetical protein